MSKVSSKELFTVCIFLVLFLLPGFGNTIMINNSGTTSIITTVIGVVVGIIPILLVIYIRKYMKENNIFEINKKYKIIGFILNMILILFAIYLLFVGGWVVNNFVISQYLTRGSYLVIAFLNGLLVSFIAIKGTEVLSRSSLILFAIFFIVMILAAIFLIPISDLENLYPILNISSESFISGSLLYPCFASIPFLFLLCIRNNQVTDNKLNKRIILAYVIASVIACFFIFLIISIFGENIATTLTYPEYLLFRKIKAFSFVERVENVTSITIFLCFAVGFSFVLLFLKKGLKAIFNIKNKTKLNITLIVVNQIIAISGVFLFTNFKIQFLYEIFPIISGCMIIVLLFICILLFITKKKAE